MAFCKNCGNQLNEQGVCVNCANQTPQPSTATPEQPAVINVQQPAQTNNFANNQQPAQTNNFANNQQSGDNFNSQQNQVPPYQQDNNFNNNQQNSYQQNSYQQNSYQQNNANSTESKFKDFIFNTKDETANFDPADVKENSALSLVAYLGFLFFVPIVAKPTSRYSRFHANQGLILFIASAILNIARVIVVSLVDTIFSYSPLAIIGNIITGLLSAAVSIAMLGYLVLGIYNAVKGFAKELPIIGRFRLLKDLQQ